ncbi:hypothetical protein SUGI_0323240 [Cryptomeria japonica]|nr:hypothetical protein SUGI_0323240 [Cryptomeria japonica]
MFGEIPFIVRFGFLPNLEKEKKEKTQIVYQYLLNLSAYSFPSRNKSFCITHQVVYRHGEPERWQEH